MYDLPSYSFLWQWKLSPTGQALELSYSSRNGVPAYSGWAHKKRPGQEWKNKRRTWSCGSEGHGSEEIDCLIYLCRMNDSRDPWKCFKTPKGEHPQGSPMCMGIDYISTQGIKKKSWMPWRHWLRSMIPGGDGLRHTHTERHNGGR